MSAPTPLAAVESARAARAARLDVVASNHYRGNRKRRAWRRHLADTRAHVLLVCEGERAGWIAGYRRVTAPADWPRPARAMRVYVRNDVDVHGLAVYRLSPEVAGVRNTHDRWAAVALLEHAGHRWAAISVHANPRPSRDERVEHANTLYVRGLRILCRAYTQLGYTPVLGGDWNDRRSQPGAPVGTPGRLAMWLDGEARLHGIDGFVVAEGVTVTRFAATPAPGADHKKVAATLTAPKEHR